VVFSKLTIFCKFEGIFHAKLAKFAAKNAKMQKKEIILESTISCPECGFRKKERMPEDSCLYFYECENCKSVLKPKDGKCCVFCSYGDVKCPSKQNFFLSSS